MTYVRTGDSCDTVIIGAGLAGLVTGAYLARSGLTVLICEQAPQVGG
jgi:phytoene dehydrogenase-like protein